MYILSFASSNWNCVQESKVFFNHSILYPHLSQTRLINTFDNDCDDLMEIRIKFINNYIKQNVHKKKYFVQILDIKKLINNFSAHSQSNPFNKTILQ